MNVLTPAKLVLNAWLLMAATGFAPVEVLVMFVSNGMFKIAIEVPFLLQSVMFQMLSPSASVDPEM